jgi:phosphohistidine phosphatase SixA
MLRFVFMRNGEYDPEAKDLSVRGKAQVANFYDFMKSEVGDSERVKVFNSGEKRTRRSASELAHMFQGVPLTLEVLSSDYRGSFVQGVGRHIPADVSVVACVSHSGRIEEIVRELVGQQVFQEGSPNEGAMLKDLGNGEGLVIHIPLPGHNGKIIGGPFRQPLMD